MLWYLFLLIAFVTVINCFSESFNSIAKEWVSIAIIVQFLKIAVNYHNS